MVRKRWRWWRMKEAITRTDSAVGVRGWITPALLNATSAPWTKEMRRVGGRDLIVNMDDGGERREEKRRKEEMKREAESGLQSRELPRPYFTRTLLSLFVRQLPWPFVSDVSVHHMSRLLRHNRTARATNRNELNSLHRKQSLRGHARRLSRTASVLGQLPWALLR